MAAQTTWLVVPLRTYVQTSKACSVAFPTSNPINVSNAPKGYNSSVKMIMYTTPHLTKCEVRSSIVRTRQQYIRIHEMSIT